METEIQIGVEQWLKDVVIGLMLCPFASLPFKKGRVKFHIEKSKTEEEIINSIKKECEYLELNSDIETTLIICPNMFKDFFDFVHFLPWAQSAIKKQNWQGVFQLAHFHPNYIFAGTEDTDPQNLTNRSPYPIVHVLREASLEAALENTQSPESIPEKNIQTMNELSEKDKLRYFHYLFSN